MTSSNCSADDNLKISKLSSMLIDEKIPLKLRFRILFTLRSLNDREAIDGINRGFKDSSALLKHECAYCLGQMANQYSIPYLINVLNDDLEDSMVRHEAGEALGAIGDYNNQNASNTF